MSSESNDYLYYLLSIILFLFQYLIFFFLLKIEFKIFFIKISYQKNLVISYIYSLISIIDFKLIIRLRIFIQLNQIQISN